MRLYHALALALVSLGWYLMLPLRAMSPSAPASEIPSLGQGWYLMMPPTSRTLTPAHLITVTIMHGADLSEWAIYQSFDTESACRKARDELQNQPVPRGSRNGKDFSAKFQAVAEALSKLPDETVIDGEIVAFDEAGRPSFSVLQNFGRGEPTLIFSAFDLLTLRGEDIMHRPLDQRRELLRNKLIPGLPIRFDFQKRSQLPLRDCSNRSAPRVSKEPSPSDATYTSPAVVPAPG